MPYAIRNELIIFMHLDFQMSMIYEDVYHAIRLDASTMWIDELYENLDE